MTLFIDKDKRMYVALSWLVGGVGAGLLPGGFCSAAHPAEASAAPGSEEDGPTEVSMSGVQDEGSARDGRTGATEFGEMW